MAAMVRQVEGVVGGDIVCVGLPIGRDEAEEALEAAFVLDGFAALRGASHEGDC